MPRFRKRFGRLVVSGGMRRRSPLTDYLRGSTIEGANDKAKAEAEKWPARVSRFGSPFKYWATCARCGTPSEDYDNPLDAEMVISRHYIVVHRQMSVEFVNEWKAEE